MFKIRRPKGKKSKEFYLIVTDMDNGRKEVTTETYKRKAGVYKAIKSIIQAAIGRGAMIIDETETKPLYQYMTAGGLIRDYRGKSDFLTGKASLKSMWQDINKEQLGKRIK